MAGRTRRHFRMLSLGVRRNGLFFLELLLLFFLLPGIIKKTQYHEKHQQNEINNVPKLHILINFARELLVRRNKSNVFSRINRYLDKKKSRATSQLLSNI